MASKQIFTIFFAIVAVLLHGFALAKEFIVGDEIGWTINFEYQVWAEGKEFHVGDKLVFKYPMGAHNVHKVNATGFQNCEVPASTTETDGPLATGNDEVMLATPGKKWYICGVGKHCEVGGQKLAITVLADQSTGSPETPSTPNQGYVPTGNYASIIAASGVHQALAAVGVSLVTLVLSVII